VKVHTNSSRCSLPVALMDVESRVEYLNNVKKSGVYTEEEIFAIERLIMSEVAVYFMDVINTARERQVQHEIEEMLV